MAARAISGQYEPMSARRTLFALAVVPLLIGACSDDSDDGAGDSPSVADGSRSESFKADLALAEAAVLTLQDLPTGWSSKPREEEDGDDEVDEKFADCLDVPVEEVTDSGHPLAESETFVAEDDSEVEAEVGVAPSVEEAADHFDMATSPEYLDCVRAVLPSLMEEAAKDEGGEFEIADASIGPLRIEESGDRSAGFRMALAIETQGLSIDFYYDILFAQVGRASAQVTSMAVFTPPDVGFTQSLLDQMIDRIDPGAVG